MASNSEHQACIICGSKKVHYGFSLDKFRIEKCDDCGFMRLNPQPTDEALAKIDSSPYFLGSEKSETQTQATALKSSTANAYLDLLAAYARIPLTGTLLEIGCGHGDFLLQAAKRGLTVTGIEYSQHAVDVAASKLEPYSGQVICGEITKLLESKQQFDYIVFTNVLEHVRDPHAFLQSVYTLLKKEGMVAAVVPSLDSLSARFMKNKWVEFKLEHLWYFSTPTLRRLLHAEGFSEVKVNKATKMLNLDYIDWHFEHYPVKPFSNIVKFIKRCLPPFLQQRPFRVVASEIIAFARKQQQNPIKKLSVVMAAFNEEKTIHDTVEHVLAKQIPELEIELIIVESKSTDNTEAILRPYETHPRVKIVWQDKACGKGNAIREGFKHVTGDYILIQDADDEYDLEDYDVLVEPLIKGEADFVLGARHGGRAWKMRQFNDQMIASHMLNFGHWFFTTLVNVFFGLGLKDPFTMYKVFRADCLHGITFECDRFDFDFELLIKLVRNGYRPIEIPVNYRSRSFKEGKKVRVFLDPLTWLKAIIKLRLQKK